MRLLGSLRLPPYLWAMRLRGVKLQCQIFSGIKGGKSPHVVKNETVPALLVDSVSEWKVDVQIFYTSSFPVARNVMASITDPSTNLIYVACKNHS